MVKIKGKEFAAIRNDHKRTPGKQNPGLFENLIELLTTRLEVQRQLVRDHIVIIYFV